MIVPGGARSATLPTLFRLGLYPRKAVTHFPKAVGKPGGGQRWVEFTKPGAAEMLE